MEITAAYWESRIKTYGFGRNTDLSLIEMGVSTDMLCSLGQELVRLGDLGVRFHLAFTQVSGDGAVLLYLLIQREREDALVAHVRGRSPFGIGVTSPVDMISFQGPHFGERFGILDAAFQALSSKRIKVIASVCSMSCVYLVLESGQSEGAASALSEVFDVPKTFSARSQ